MDDDYVIELGISMRNWLKCITYFLKKWILVVMASHICQLAPQVRQLTMLFVEKYEFGSLTSQVGFHVISTHYVVNIVS